MKKILLLLILFPILIQAQTDTKTDSIEFSHKMQWFKEAKLGIFIHWGIYAVNGIDESWSFFNGHISHADYVKQAEKFTATKYNPNYWAELIKMSGAKYAVITSKHHDGFALWDTKFGDFNSKNNSPAKKDLIGPFVDALRENNLKVGIYYSLPDWSYSDYTHHTRKINRYKIADDQKRWDHFLNYYQGQLKELSTTYNPDLYWFDGDWEHNAKEWEIDKIKGMLSEKNQQVIFNSRLCGNGDYKTPEIGIPVYRPKSNYWELCMTMNDSWGYQGRDSNYKTPAQVIDVFVDCISKGGNLLLDIGPKADGSIPIEQKNILIELGKWTKKHAEAIYTSKQGIPYEHYYGPTSLSSDSTILYVYVRDIPKDGKIVLKGIINDISSVYIVGSKKKLNHQTYCSPSWSSYPGLLYIDIPKSELDIYYTVLAIQLNGKIKLYNKQNGAIESN